MPWQACHLLSFSLERKGPKVQGRLNRSSPRPSKCLTLRSRSDFFEVKRQAPLREGQALSRPLRTLPRTSAVPLAPNPVGRRRSRSRWATLRPLGLIAEEHPRSPERQGVPSAQGIAGLRPRSPKGKRYYSTILFFNTIPDSKRQQTITVDYKRLLNGLVLTGFASLLDN